MAALVAQVGKIVEYLRSNSTQPTYRTTWATLYKSSNLSSIKSTFLPQQQNNMEQLCFRKDDDLESNEIDDGGFADRRKKHKSSSALRVALEKLLLIACLVVSAVSAMLFDLTSSSAEEA